MNRLDAALRIAGIVLALTLSALACVVAVASSTRTTVVSNGVVLRENLLTGKAEFCDFERCRTKPELLDFSDRAVRPAE